MTTTDQTAAGVDADEALDVRDRPGPEVDAGGGDTKVATSSRRRPSLVRRQAMRARGVVVKAHRWLSFGLLAWLLIVCVTGGWLAVEHGIDSVRHSDRYHATDGDVGPQAALDAAAATLPDDAAIYGLALPSNGRGVYQVGAETETGPEQYRYDMVYVDPGTGAVNAVHDEVAGFSNWMFRGHMYLWQDFGVFGVLDPEDGWCRVDANGAEPGGVRGVVCDVIPTGDDMVACFGVGWIVVLVTGFDLWYWPGCGGGRRPWRVKRGRGRFTFHMGRHKVIGFVVWVPLLVVSFTGIAFAFPALGNWYDRATPAQSKFTLWTPPEEAEVSGEAAGREPIDLDGAERVLTTRFPDRRLDDLLTPADETGTYSAWMTRGFSPWTREGGAGNVDVVVDQYSGDVLYDGTPEEGNVFDQAWDDWSYPLHTGDFLGTSTRILWVLLALTPLALGVTGVVMDRVRHNKRARRAARPTSEPAAAAPEPAEVPA